MRSKKSVLTRLGVSGLLVLFACGSLNADIVTVPLISWTGVDSGWSVTYDDAYVDIAVDLVNMGKDFVLIEVSKDFAQPGYPLTSILMDFIQREDDAQTVSTIIIADESITNLTGVAWTDYHWQLLDHDEVWFDIELSTTFGIQADPHFKTQIWHTLPNDPSKANALTVEDGVVADFSSYFPGMDASDLVIAVDLGNEGPVSFEFKQYPTPAPATMALMGLGLVAIVLQGKRRR